MNRTIASSLLIAMAAAFSFPEIGAAQSQSQPAARGTLAATKPAVTAATATKPAASSSLSGTWTGQVAQMGRDAPFAIIVTIDAGQATTTYPEQGCSGKLTRIGSSGTYVFYSEKITKGIYDKTKNAGCLDGMLAMTRAGGSVLMSWFGVLNNEPYQAAAKLAPRNTPI
jgi:hypothetical protein